MSETKQVLTNGFPLKDVPIIDENQINLQHISLEKSNSFEDRVGKINKRGEQQTLFNIRYFKDQKVKEFYEQQKELIEKYEEDLNVTKIDNLTQEEKDNEVKKKKRQNCLELIEKITFYFSFACNIFLFVLKLIASIISLSISVIASTLDSFLDLFSGLILFIATQIRTRNSKMDFYNFPVGKSRIEPIGIIIFAAIMITASLEVIKEAVTEIINYFTLPQNWASESLLQQYIGIAVLAFVIVLKSFLYIICRIQTNSSLLQALSIDHRNDVVSNSFLLVAIISKLF